LSNESACQIATWDNYSHHMQPSSAPGSCRGTTGMFPAIPAEPAQSATTAALFFPVGTGLASCQAEEQASSADRSASPGRSLAKKAGRLRRLGPRVSGRHRRPVRRLPVPGSPNRAPAVGRDRARRRPRIPREPLSWDRRPFRDTIFLPGCSSPQSEPYYGLSPNPTKFTLHVTFFALPLPFSSLIDSTQIVGGSRSTFRKKS
jgi:hypothetical protein